MEENKGFDLNEYIKDMVFVVRDCNLSKDIAEKYQPGIIIKERAFVDASYMVGGIVTSHRFAILSNQFRNFEIDEKTKGLCVANRDSRFKVVDKYTINGKTQITLLHLPNDEKWKSFKNITYILEKKIAMAARKQFEFMLTCPPIKSQNTPQFLDRFSFPLGIDNDGSFFPID